MLDMAFGPPPYLDKPLDKFASLAAQFVVGPETMRRARSLVANAALYIQNINFIRMAK